jgi:hypothetical protein
MAWTSDIKGALTIPVLAQYVQVYQCLQAVQLTPAVEDTLHWRWSTDGVYSSRSAYAALLLGQSAVLGTKELWKIKSSQPCCWGNRRFSEPRSFGKSKAPNKCRFFIWLALLGRCWTVERKRVMVCNLAARASCAFKRPSSLTTSWFDVFFEGRSSSKFCGALVGTL